jgi:myo-inositol-1(or 4)-monophosphatase
MKKFLITLVETAGKILQKYFYLSTQQLELEYKSKNNPVTKADKEAEEVIKELISKKFPNDKFICEESFNKVNEI